jgi:predicted N-formylglutamate amidohydrolase
MMSAVLLSSEEVAPFDVQGDQGRSPFFFVCDHAGRRIPRALGTLGLSAEDLVRHIAWDLGAVGVARGLSAALEACVVWQQYSRLVIDCNRPPGAVDSIVPVSDRTNIPGNQGLPPGAAEERAREIFHPYHAEIRRRLDQRSARGLPTVLVAVHSFTPEYQGVARPWHVGVLHGRDKRLALPLMHALHDEGDLVVGDNQPYALGDLTDYSILNHGERRAIPHVEIEIRQDLLADEAGQRAWAERLARVLAKVAASASLLATVPSR